jgi:hypothetical protein
MKPLITLVFLLWFVAKSQSQVYVIVPMGAVVPLGAAIMPEHGFLPGKKFTYYSAIDKYDFGGRSLRVELTDNRDSLRLSKLECSNVDITNTSEFRDKQGAYAVYEYFRKLFDEAGLKIDSTAGDTLRAELEALDSRLIGFGSITAHGLCRMTIKYRHISKSYCIDITDKDKHSPIGKNAFVTRKTATRIITSAAIREVIELFLIDLKASGAIAP